MPKIEGIITLKMNTDLVYKDESFKGYEYKESEKPMGTVPFDKTNRDGSY